MPDTADRLIAHALLQEARDAFYRAGALVKVLAQTTASAEQLQSEHERLNQLFTRHYTSLLHYWLRQLYPGAVQILSFGDYENAVARAEGLQPDPRALSGLSQVLTELYQDAYLGGIHHAQPQVQSIPLGGVLSEAQWDTWEPLGTTTAALVNGPGLEQLIAQSPQLSAQVAQTLRKRLSNAAEKALESDQGELRDKLRDITTSHHQAAVIASTEAARAQTAATLDAYEYAGVTEFNWDTDTDPCPACAAMQALNPHTVGSEVPPLHPNCRCSISPATKEDT
jgi:SPP1 gp7 family putative phage head morphogenesis protein